MDFKVDRPIFRQIEDWCHSHILTGEWTPGEKVPSVRELSVKLAVNTHTVLKAFDLLQADGIIAARRGMGFFLADDAPLRVLESKRKEFYETRLQDLFHEMKRLGITIDDVTARWNEYAGK